MFSDTYAPIDLARPWLKLKHCLSHGITSPVWHGWSTSFYKAKPFTSHQSHPKRRGMINLVVVYQLWNHPRRELWMIYNPMWMISWTSWCFWSTPSERRLWQQMMRASWWRPGFGWMGSWVSICHDFPVLYIKDAIRFNQDPIFHTFYADPLHYERICVTATHAWKFVFHVFGFIRIHWWYCKWLTLLWCPVTAFWCDLLVMQDYVCLV